MLVLNCLIAPLGKAYVVTLDAQNTASGDDIASEEATAPDKEHVLEALNQGGDRQCAPNWEKVSPVSRDSIAPFGQAIRRRRSKLSAPTP